MDFIERWFGVSPDGGKGSLEMMLGILVLMVAIAGLRFLRRNRARLQIEADRDVDPARAPGR